MCPKPVSPPLYHSDSISRLDKQIVHFDDVPYMHQHLVANLPESLAPPLIELMRDVEQVEAAAVPIDATNDLREL